MTHSDEPVPQKPRWMVWTDDQAEGFASKAILARWFWAASGPRGHMNGAESTADEAVTRAGLASMQLDAAEAVR